MDSVQCVCVCVKMSYITCKSSEWRQRSKQCYSEWRHLLENSIQCKCSIELELIKVTLRQSESRWLHYDETRSARPNTLARSTLLCWSLGARRCVCVCVCVCVEGKGRLHKHSGHKIDKFQPGPLYIIGYSPKVDTGKSIQCIEWRLRIWSINWFKRKKTNWRSCPDHMCKSVQTWWQY